MKRLELENKIRELSQSSALIYSLDGDVVHGTVMERASRDCWRVFNYDSTRGYEGMERRFNSEEAAFDRVYELLLTSNRALEIMLAYKEKRSKEND